MFTDNIVTSIKEFKERIKISPDFCQELFRDSTIKLLAAKYAYYVLNNPYLNDDIYDLMEKDWYVMGRGLDLVKEGDHSPCVDFDGSHELAPDAIQLAMRLKKK